MKFTENSNLAPSERPEKCAATEFYDSPSPRATRKNCSAIHLKVVPL